MFKTSMWRRPEIGLPLYHLDFHRIFHENRPGPPPAAPAAPPSVRDQRMQSQRAAVPEPAFPPAPAPSTYGASVGDTAGPYYENQGQTVPAAFRVPPQQSGRLPGYGHQPQYQAQHKRAWMVQIQGPQGVTRVRAVSPTGVRQGETPPEGWHTEFVLGSVKLSNAHHRILPDIFLQGAVAYPGA